MMDFFRYTLLLSQYGLKTAFLPLAAELPAALGISLGRFAIYEESMK